jgi:hypothetical protein
MMSHLGAGLQPTQSTSPARAASIAVTTSQIVVKLFRVAQPIGRYLMRRLVISSFTCVIYFVAPVALQL